MKQILILFLLFPLLLIALESDPSEVVGYVKYEGGVAGYQFVANSMATGYSLASELGNAIGITNCNSISIWNASSQGWLTSTYIFGSWNNDQAIVEGDVIMCGMLNPTDVYMTGELPTLPSYSLQVGYSSVMIPLDRSDITTASQLGNEIGSSNVNSINTWDAVNQIWVTTSYIFGSWNNDQPLEIGNPILLGVSSNSTWPTTRITESIVISPTEGASK